MLKFVSNNKKAASTFRQASLSKNSAFTSILQHQSAKGTSSWLTTLPIANLGFVMNKREFQDALWPIYNMDVPKLCACGKSNSMDHALSCMKGKFSILRHNNVRDTEADILREVCKDVTIEPPLIPSDKLGDRSKLNIGARGLWISLERTLCDVRIFHPGAPS